jgi:RimJ/RimL family protein N-acetyltransferase
MITIRKLDLNDLSQFIDLRLKALKEVPEAFASTYQKECDLQEEVFANRLKITDNQFTIGAFADNQLIYVAAFFRETREKTKHKGNVVAVYCLPEYRKKEIATKVMETLIAEVRKIPDLAVLNLSVVSENKQAKYFYEKLGFVVYGTEPKALFDGQKYFDEYLLQLSL